MYKPIIGIVGRCSINQNGTSTIEIMEYYRRAIIKCGGNPISILPPQDTDYVFQKVSENAALTEEEKEMLNAQLDLCDGIISPGGIKTFEFDNYIINYCINKDKPILGICLGMQIMASYGINTENTNIMFKTERNSEEGISHCEEKMKYVHKVNIDKNSKFYEILGTTSLDVNSMHNYHAIESPIYDIVGYSEDGLIEVVENKNNKFNIGVQWHPERLLDDDLQNKIMSKFIESCKDK